MTSKCKITGCDLECVKHPVTGKYTHGTCRPHDRVRAAENDRLKGAAALRIFGPGKGVQPHQQRWKSLTKEQRKGALDKQRQIDAGGPITTSGGTILDHPDPAISDLVLKNRADKIARKKTGGIRGHPREMFVYIGWVEDDAGQNESKIGMSDDPSRRAREGTKAAWVKNAPKGHVHKEYHLGYMTIYKAKVLENAVHRAFKERGLWIEEYASVEWFRINVEEAERLVERTIYQEQVHERTGGRHRNQWTVEAVSSP